MDENRPLRTVMIVDDDEVDQRSFERIIKRSGWFDCIVSFNCAEDALAYLESPLNRRIDMMLLDIHMPGMNGFAFLDSAKMHFGDDFAKIVVFVLTTSLNEADRERSAQYSTVRDYVAKPLTTDKLEVLIEHLSESALAA